MRIPRPPDVAGVSWRPATVGDAEALANLFNAIGEAEGTPERMSPETLLHDDLASPHADLERKTGRRLRPKPIGRPSKAR